MFREKIGNVAKEDDNKNNEEKIFENWEEKDIFVANKLTELKSEEIYNFFNNFVDERGDFKNFLTSDNIQYFGGIMKEVAPLSKVKKGMNPNYDFRFRGSYEIDPDYDLILETALPDILSKKVSVKEHQNNLSLITAAIQCREYLSENFGDGAGERNSADVQHMFKNFIKQPNASVLEKLYINYLGGQFNQNDSWYINKDLKKYNPESYQKFLKEQPDIQKFQRKEININDLSLSYLSHRALLRDKFGFTPLSFDETDIWEEKNLMLRFITDQEQRNKLKKGTRDKYSLNNFNGLDKNKIIKEFYSSKTGRLSHCVDKINPLDRTEVDGEYIVADLSPEFFGVYSVSGNLEAFFEKNSLNGENTIESIKSHDFAEIKKQINFVTNHDLAGFKLMSSLFFRDKLKEMCGVDAGELNLRTQYQFLNFISEYSEEDLNNLNKFLNNSISENGRINRLKSFLCLELDKNLGDKLVSLGDNFTTAQADILYSKIAEINDLASKEESELRNLLMKTDKNFDFSGLKSELLRRAQTLVIKFSQAEDNKFKKNKVDQIFSELENIKTEMILFSSLLKSAKENKQAIDLETIKDLDLRVKDYGEKITSQEQAEILNMARANWSDFGNLKMADVVLNGLEKSLTDDKSQRAYILKYKDEVIAFVRFQLTENGTLYAGSFNVVKDLRGLSIGNDLMERALIKEGENNILEATASIKIPAGCSYVEKIGFVADGLIENYHNTGESLFNITLDKKNNKNYNLRLEGKEKPLSSTDLKKEAKSYQDLDNLIGHESFVLRFDLNSEMDSYQKTLSKLLTKRDEDGRKLEDGKNKYTLTRYFYDKEESPNGKIRYLAFEKNH